MKCQCLFVEHIRPLSAELAVPMIIIVMPISSMVTELPETVNSML